MSRRPSDIRIADLARPVLTPTQIAAVEHAEKQPVRFDVDGILGAARAKTGLSDFGREDFRARLAIQCQAVDEDAELNALGRLGIFANLMRYAQNRLRFQDLLRRHPEILSVPIERPLIVAGMPRTGTTHLLNLIAADTRLRSLPYWESLEPVPVPGEGPGRDGRDPRWHRCNGAYQQMVAHLPLIVAMHDMPPEHIHEEIELEELDFASYLLEWLCRPHRWRDYYLGLDQRPHYAYMKRVLQALTWLRGPRRWVLKSPQHLEHLPALLDTFPDATLVITHRDPVSVFRSAITMSAYGDRMRRSRVDVAATAAYWLDRVEKLLSACLRDRDQLPAAQVIDVPFHEFMADDVGTVGRIYERAGLPMTPTARAEQGAFLAANPRGKHGQVIYDLRGDFGLEPSQVRKRFRAYVERFGVRGED